MLRAIWINLFFCCSSLVNVRTHSSFTKRPSNQWINFDDRIHLDDFGTFNWINSRDCVVIRQTWFSKLFMPRGSLSIRHIHKEKKRFYQQFDIFSIVQFFTICSWEQIVIWPIYRVYVIDPLFCIGLILILTNFVKRKFWSGIPS